MIIHPIHGTFLRDVCGFSHYMKLYVDEIHIICNFGEKFFKTRVMTIDEYNAYCLTCWWLGETAQIIKLSKF
jgi:hypothetical protein